MDGTSLDSAAVSVVIQGPLIGRPADPAAEQVTRRCVEQIRSVLAHAELILSTWEGSETTGINVDRVVLNRDPGGWKRDDGVACNVNRQIVSTAAGLAVATRPFALKIRTDTTLLHDGFIAAQREFHPRSSANRVFEQRILTLEKYTRHPGRIPLLHHPSDLFQFGRTSDLRRLWSVGLENPSDMVGWSKRADRPRLRPFHDARIFCRYADEQYIWTSCARQFHRLRTLDYLWQCRLREISQSESLLCNNFIVVSEHTAGVSLPEKFREHGWPDTCYTADEWRRLMRFYAVPTRGRHFLRATVLFSKIRFKLAAKAVKRLAKAH